MVLSLLALHMGTQQRGRALTGGRFCFGRGRLLVFVEYGRCGARGNGGRAAWVTTSLPCKWVLSKDAWSLLGAALFVNSILPNTRTDACGARGNGGRVSWC